jgi:hypothetical protein
MEPSPPEHKSITWSSSPERQQYVDGQMRKSALRAVISAVLIVAASTGIALGNESAVYAGVGAGLLVVAVGMLIWAIAPYIIARRSYLERHQADKALAVEDALEDLVGTRGDDVLPLTSLYVFNRRQLDEYQTLTKRHAAKAFRNAQIAAFCGFAVLVAGVILVLVAPTGTEDDSSRYTIGFLSGLGGVMSTYVSRTFFRSYKEAMHQLEVYYEEPFLTSRALSAERVIAKWPTLRTEGSDPSLAALIQRLLEPAPRRGAGAAEPKAEEEPEPGAEPDGEPEDTTTRRGSLIHE